MSKIDPTPSVPALTGADAERKAFELWYSDQGKYPRSVERDLEGGYRLASCATAWPVWLARAALGAGPIPTK